MKDFVITGDVPKKRKRPTGATPGVRIGHIEEVLVFGKVNATVRLINGQKAKVPKEMGVKIIMRTKKARERFLPSNFELYPYDDTVRPDEIKNVQFKYALVSLVTLYSSQSYFVPRQTADDFEATSEDFLLRKVDQPWNDLRTFPIEFRDIIRILRRDKKSARVMTVDGIAVRVTREHADAYDAWRKGEGARELETIGSALLTGIL